MIPIQEIKRLIDFKNYLNECNTSPITNETIKEYLQEDYFFKKI